MPINKAAKAFRVFVTVAAIVVIVPAYLCWRMANVAVRLAAGLLIVFTFLAGLNHVLLRSPASHAALSQSATAAGFVLALAALMLLLELPLAKPMTISSMTAGKVDHTRRK